MQYAFADCSLVATLRKMVFCKMYPNPHQPKFSLDWEKGRVNRTVSRGIRCSRLQDNWVELRKIAEEKDISDFQSFVRTLKDCHNFGGVLHRNAFKVSQDIEITGLSFFGPHKEELASYDVTIVIEDMKKQIPLMETKFHIPMVQKWELFRVEFPDAFHIEANRYYNVAFQLDGPVTGILDPDKVIGRWVDKVGANDVIEFNFLRGSLQMPELHYVTE